VRPLADTSAPVAAIERGRQAFASGAWRLAFTELSAADSVRPLGADDLALLAGVAHLLGQTSDSAAVWERAGRAWIVTSTGAWGATASPLTTLRMGTADCGGRV